MDAGLSPAGGSDDAAVYLPALQDTLEKRAALRVPARAAPPYRVPQIGRVLVRSLLDRTLLVLRRAVCVALPAGVLIWLLANAGDGEALRALTGFFDPIGRFFGLDGVILTAFLLALPANELVMPLLLLIYADLSSLTDLSSLEAFRTLLIANGWTAMTALSVCLLVLFHSPCATTLLTIRRETGSTAQTLLAVAVRPRSGSASACSCAPSGCCSERGLHRTPFRGPFENRPPNNALERDRNARKQ